MNCRGRSSWLRALSSLSILTMTSACAHVSTPPLAVDNYCEIAEPIYYDSRRDSAKTVEQVELHNKKYMCLCERDCPKLPN